jgi:hypothetical protein
VLFFGRCKIPDAKGVFALKPSIDGLKRGISVTTAQQLVEPWRLTLGMTIGYCSPIP